MLLLLSTAAVRTGHLSLTFSPTLIFLPNVAGYSGDWRDQWVKQEDFIKVATSLVDKHPKAEQRKKENGEPFTHPG